MDLDDRAFAHQERLARIAAQRIVQDLHGFHPTPTRDDAGVLRLGHGRAIEVRPQSPGAADWQLMHEMSHTVAMLRGQLLPLVELHPEVLDRLAIIYALADLMGPETMRDFNPFWESLRKGDWNSAGVTLISVQWERWLGKNMETRNKVFRLIVALSSGQTDRSLQ